MIYVTKNGEIKVWCDNNLLNSPPLPKYFQLDKQMSIHQQNTMINLIIKLIHDNQYTKPELKEKFINFWMGKDLTF